MTAHRKARGRRKPPRGGSAARGDAAKRAASQPPAPSPWPARLRALAASLGVGLLLGLPWIWFSLGWLSVVAFAGFAALIAGATPRSAFRRGWLIGLATHAIGSYWLPAVLTQFADYSAPISWLLIMILHALGALRHGLVAWVAVRLRPSPLGLFALPLAWTVSEFLWPALFPWRVAHTLLDWPVLVQTAEFAGAYGPTFLVVWGGCVLYAVAARRPRASRHGLAFLATAIACVGFGLWRMRDIDARLAEAAPLKVALVQPGGMGASFVDTSIAESVALPKDVDLVIWPESSIGAYSTTHNDFGGADILAPEEGLQFNPFDIPGAGPRCYLAGGTCVRVEPITYFNTAFLVGPDDEVLGRYHKRALIPFGEYIPGERWFPSLRKLSPWEVAFEAGTSDLPLDVPGRARLGVCICYEDVLAGLVRDTVREGADLLVNLTNDAWFGRSAALMQHQRLATLRAVENHRFLLRCTATGSTAIISPTGEVVAQAPLLKTTSLVAEVKCLDLKTLYTRVGDAFAWLCTFALVCFAIIQWRRGNQRRRPSDA